MKKKWRSQRCHNISGFLKKVLEKIQERKSQIVQRSQMKYCRNYLYPQQVGLKIHIATTQCMTNFAFDCHLVVKEKKYHSDFGEMKFESVGRSRPVNFAERYSWPGAFRKVETITQSRYSGLRKALGISQLTSPSVEVYYKYTNVNTKNSQQEKLNDLQKE